MSRSIPPILTRAAFVDTRTGVLTREGALLLDALRSALGGDAATITPVDPLGALDPLAVAMTPMEALGPVSAAQVPPDGLGPISWVIDASDSLSPVCGCDVASGIDPVSPIGPETLP